MPAVYYSIPERKFTARRYPIHIVADAAADATIRVNDACIVVVVVDTRRAFITKNIGIPMIEYTYMKFRCLLISWMIFQLIDVFF